MLRAHGLSGRRLLTLGAVALAASSMASAATRSAAPGPGATPAAEITGEVALASFPVPPVAVAVLHDGAPIQVTNLSKGGSFSVSVPPGSGFALAFITGGTSYPLLFPRGGKTVDSVFAVRGRRQPFNIGWVQYVEHPATASFVVSHRVPKSDAIKSTCVLGQLCVDDVEGGEDVCGPVPATSSAPRSEPSMLPSEGSIAERNLPPTLGCAVNR